MDYDVFFSICQTPVAGHMPSEAEMFRNFLDEVKAADRLGYGVAWIAESHFSTEVQKRHEHPVVPFFPGEIGLNTDFLQLSQRVFAETERIETGSAVMNVLVNGGPVAAAERVAAFLALHGLDPDERRRIHVGFAAGRFDFMNRTTGIAPRDEIEERAWKVVRGKVFEEAAEIFVRLLTGEILRSDQVRATTLTRADFRSDDEWEGVRAAARDLGRDGDEIAIPRRFVFEDTMIVPHEFRRDLLVLQIGSHDPRLQEEVNRLAPVRVFNLSFTGGDVIEKTHERMATSFHADGGPWKRSYMPRTTMVFLNEEEGLSPAERRERAAAEAKAALSTYWKALEGTVDPDKVANAAENALVGNAEDVAEQALERYHPDERLMLWFDFFNHDAPRVIRNMEAFTEKVRPRIEENLRR